MCLQLPQCAHGFWLLLFLLYTPPPGLLQSFHMWPLSLQFLYLYCSILDIVNTFLYSWVAYIKRVQIVLKLNFMVWTWSLDFVERFSTRTQAASGLDILQFFIEFLDKKSNFRETMKRWNIKLYISRMSYGWLMKFY